MPPADPPASVSLPERYYLRRALLVDVVLPLAAVQILERVFAVAAIPAFAVAALFPLASVFIIWRKERRVEWIGLGVLVSLAFGLVMAFLTDHVGFAALKGAPLFALFGAANLISLGRRTPLMFFVARIFEAQGDPVRIAAWNECLRESRFLAAMRRLSLVWGLACLAQSVLGTAAAFLLPPNLALVAEPLLALTTITALLAWTYSGRVRAAAGSAANSP